MKKQILFISMVVLLQIANCQLPTCILDVLSLAAGTYYLEIYDGKTSVRKVFTKKYQEFASTKKRMEPKLQ